MPRLAWSTAPPNYAPSKTITCPPTSPPSTTHPKGGQPSPRTHPPTPHLVVVPALLELAQQVVVVMVAQAGQHQLLDVHLEGLLVPAGSTGTGVA